MRAINSECLKRYSLLDNEDARKQIALYVNYHYAEQIHSSLHYLTPEDFLLGRVSSKLKKRQKKMNDALKNRKNY